MSDIEERQRKLREKLEAAQKKGTPKTLPPLESKPTQRRKSIVDKGKDLLKFKSGDPVHPELDRNIDEPSKPISKDGPLLSGNTAQKINGNPKFEYRAPRRKSIVERGRDLYAYVGNKQNLSEPITPATNNPANKPTVPTEAEKALRSRKDYTDTKHILETKFAKPNGEVVDTRAQETMLVAPEKICYTSGDVLRGTLYVKLNQSVEGPPIIELVGEEFTFIHFEGPISSEASDASGKKANNPSNKDTPQTSSKIRKIFRIAHPLGKSLSIGPGNFEFPFCIMLPDALPSSFKIESTDTCGIRYYLRASVSSYSAPRVYFQLIKSSNSLILHSKVYTEPAQVPVSTCCIRNRGVFTITGTVNKPIFHAGECAIVEVGVSNNTDVDLQSIHITVTQMISFKTGEKSQQFCNIINRKTLEVSKSKLGRKHEYRKMADLAKSNSDAVVEIQTGVIPLFSLPSYFGVLIQIQYCINMVCEMSSRFTSAPSIDIPIMVQSQVAAKKLDIVPYTLSPFTEHSFQGLCLQEYHGLIVDRDGVGTTYSQPPAKAMPITKDWIGKVVSFNVLNEYSNQFEFGDALSLMDCIDFNLDVSDTSVKTSIYPTFSSNEILLSTIKYSFDQNLVIDRFITAAAADTEGKTNYAKSVLEEMSPEMFGAIITEIKFDVPRGAVRLAQSMISNNIQFTCLYAVECIRTQPLNASSRVDLVKALSPLCSDIEINKEVILSHLSAYQRALLDEVIGAPT